MTGARDKLYTVVGVNIQKREMVLSPNDEKVANSCKKKNIPNSRLECTNLPYFRPKWSKLIPYFRPKRLLKNHTVESRL